jgi:hypothetical protein
MPRAPWIYASLVTSRSDMLRVATTLHSIAVLSNHHCQCTSVPSLCRVVLLLQQDSIPYMPANGVVRVVWGAVRGRWTLAPPSVLHTCSSSSNIRFEQALLEVHTPVMQAPAVPWSWVRNDVTSGLPFRTSDYAKLMAKEVLPVQRGCGG